MLIREKPRVYIDPNLKKRLNVLAAQREATQNEVLELALKIGLDSLEEVAA